MLSQLVSRPMQIAFFAAILFAFSPLAHAAGTARPAGQNCALVTPPAGAGEEMNHGVLLRIYPRAKDIGADYSGCQVMFAPHAEGWQIVALTEVVGGDPIRIWSEHERDQTVLACRYKGGKVVAGNAEKCPAVEFLLVKSLAPGCGKLLQEAAAKGGLGAQYPAHCVYE